MTQSRHIAIAEVTLAADGRLLVVPSLPPDRDYSFIYRDGSGVRWLEAERALVPVDMGTSSLDFWFTQIAKAVQREYGDALVVTDSTRWSNIEKPLCLL